MYDKKDEDYTYFMGKIGWIRDNVLFLNLDKRQFYRFRRIYLRKEKIKRLYDGKTY